MSKKTSVMSAAVGSLLALGAFTLSAGAQAEDAAKEKCYGVAKAGQNGCAANGHSCQGQAKMDNDPGEWKNVDKGQCAKMAARDPPSTQSVRRADF
jgi:uncharacterized membrane protein